MRIVTIGCASRVLPAGTDTWVHVVDQAVVVCPAELRDLIQGFCRFQSSRVLINIERLAAPSRIDLIPGFDGADPDTRSALAHKPGLTLPRQSSFVQFHGPRTYVGITAIQFHLAEDIRAKLLLLSPWVFL